MQCGPPRGLVPCQSASPPGSIHARPRRRTATVPPPARRTCRAGGATRADSAAACGVPADRAGRQCRADRLRSAGPWPGRLALRIAGSLVPPGAGRGAHHRAGNRGGAHRPGRLARPRTAGQAVPEFQPDDVAPSAGRSRALVGGIAASRYCTVAAGGRGHRADPDRRCRELRHGHVAAARAGHAICIGRLRLRPCQPGPAGASVAAVRQDRQVAGARHCLMLAAAGDTACGNAHDERLRRARHCRGNRA
ncbi:hypothetical protein D9M68_441190 [compost metagenome]